MIPASDLYLMGLLKYDPKVFFEPLMDCLINPETKEILVIREARITVSTERPA